MWQINEVTGEKSEFNDFNELKLAPAQAIWIFADKNMPKKIYEKNTIHSVQEIIIDNFHL